MYYEVAQCSFTGIFEKKMTRTEKHQETHKKGIKGVRLDFSCLTPFDPRRSNPAIDFSRPRMIGRISSSSANEIQTECLQPNGTCRE